MKRSVVVTVAIMILTGLTLTATGTNKSLSISYQYLESAFWAGLIYQNSAQEISLWRQISWQHKNTEKFTGMWALEGSSFIQESFGQISIGLRLETKLNWFRSVNKFVIHSIWPQVFICWMKSYTTKTFVLTHWLGIAWSCQGDLNWFWPIFRIQFSL